MKSGNGNAGDSPMLYTVDRRTSSLCARPSGPPSTTRCARTKARLLRGYNVPPYVSRRARRSERFIRPQCLRHAGTWIAEAVWKHARRRPKGVSNRTSMHNASHRHSRHGRPSLWTCGARIFSPKCNLDLALWQIAVVHPTAYLVSLCIPSGLSNRGSHPDSHKA